MPTVLDLFAGCGGMTLGFVQAGFTPVLAVEWDAAAAATYAANFGDHVVCDDIANLRSADVPRVDVVIGGPPCQGFSNLGRRDGADPRNRLWREYVRVVAAARPRVFVLENVERFARSPEFAALVGETGDYSLTWGVLNAADYGVPQRRQRTIVIGSRTGPVPLPAPTHSEWVAVSSALAGLPARPATTALPARRVERFGAVLPGEFSGLDLHVGRRPTELSRRRYECIPPGGGRFDLPDELLPDCWRNKPTGTTDVMGRMHPDRPSLTIRTEFFKPEKGQYLHPRWNRPITHLEAARLQTFPDDYKWCGTKLDIARQIGNAVPPRLAEAVAQSARSQ